ncbi:hypothetical protein NE237_014731 [Protea cynaroides]|uniref:Uncharacterized protein n=1 Tax=Protea cynaroides TaxID=273540 RepID=A0A9Q0KCP3_9MAGN|nr:hypothetical protein NE237_014731 [Protea cynaroides]
MTSLRQLYLIGFEELKSLPEGLQQLTMLEELRIGWFSVGPLDFIKGEEDLQHLVSLQQLTLLGWNLTKLTYFLENQGLICSLMLSPKMPGLEDAEANMLPIRCSGGTKRSYVSMFSPISSSQINSQVIDAQAILELDFELIYLWSRNLWKHVVACHCT